MPVRRSAPLRALAVAAARAPTGCGAGGVPSVEKANDLLRTTAFADGSQELWWDPGRGLRREVTRSGGSGEMCCGDGETYTGAALLADALKRKGEDVTVPTGMTDVFVRSSAPRGCEAYFRIPDDAERIPASDRTTEYDSYGGRFAIEMPPDGRTMSMDGFRRRVGG
ncbi:hypothetical protein [Streptomyces sp. S1]|uniref:hypothetical protein n=1 Tax=Streptomyces sp. S1 TaxID=718288 RepID=UPI003D736762